MRLPLIDGDTVVYQAGLDAQRATDWGDGCWTLHAEEADGASVLDSLITRIREGMNADRVIVALSDYDTPGWRYSVLPTYKAARATKKVGNGRPLLWQFLREYFVKHYETFVRPGLEGDDVLGILATTNNRKVIPAGVERVVCSIDKDLRSVPGYHLNFTRNATAFGWEVQEVTEAEADRFHLYQTLTGDVVDGYKGCPGTGPVAANRILDPHTGPNHFDVRAAWPDVVKAYEKAKLTEEDALVQARVARICRSSDWDYDGKRVILWNPPTA